MPPSITKGPLIPSMGAMAMKAAGGALKKFKLKKKPKVKPKKFHVKAKKKGFKVPISKKNGKTKADFSNHLIKKPGIKNPVPIMATGSRRLDEKAANAAAGLKKTPKNATWHHAKYDPATGKMKMELVDKKAHRAVGHSGGVHEYEVATGKKYK